MQSAAVALQGLRTARGSLRVEQVPRRQIVRRHDVAGPVRQPLAVFQLPQFLRQGNANIGIRTDGEGAPCREEFLPVEYAIAKIGLGDRTQAGNGAGLRQPPGLRVVHLGGVDQAPARIDTHLIQQIFNRTGAQPGLDVFDFPDLFGCMNMDWPLLKA